MHRLLWFPLYEGSYSGSIDKDLDSTEARYQDLIPSMFQPIDVYTVCTVIIDT